MRELARLDLFKPIAVEGGDKQHFIFSLFIFIQLLTRKSRHPQIDNCLQQYRVNGCCIWAFP
jgi:hypothetical protein